MRTCSTHRDCYSSWEREALLFHRATAEVQAAQESILRKILRENSATEYGERCSFAEITSSHEYRERVPLVDYAAIGSYMERIAAGERDILFRGKPLCLQPTSGTTSASKMIPFTAALRKEFQRGVAAWHCDMWSHMPGLRQGKVYWSVSPLVRESRMTAGGIPVGFLADTEYLTPAMASALKKTFAVPSSVGLVRKGAIFRYLTMAFLLKARDLTFVSVWNPTFFMLLLDSLRENYGNIVEDIGRGELSHLEELPKNLRATIAGAFGGADRKRAAELRSLPVCVMDDWNVIYSRLWPDLQLISCWEDAEARGPAARLRELFPAVKVQPKGLMATEAMVSIPLNDTKYPVLSLRSHYYEFIPLGDESKAVNAWEVEQDRLYEIVVTTGGGLYRYRIGDTVQVRGFYNGCPMLEFMGRGNHTSDFYGEKLHQRHVTGMIGEIFSDRDPASWFALLAPDGVEKVDHYTLFVAFDAPVDETWLTELGRQLESRLRANFHYDYCRKLGQLKQLDVCAVGLDITGSMKLYMEEQKFRGIREGEIKPALLDNRPVWRRVFGVMPA